MSRVRIFLACLVSVVTPPLAAAQQPSDSGASQFHARRLGDQPSPPATLGAVAWLAGAWDGEGLGGRSEEI